MRWRRAAWGRSARTSSRRCDVHAEGCGVCVHMFVEESVDMQSACN